MRKQATLHAVVHRVQARGQSRKDRLPRANRSWRDHHYDQLNLQQTKLVLPKEGCQKARVLGEAYNYQIVWTLER